MFFNSMFKNIFYIAYIDNIITKIKRKTLQLPVYLKGFLKITEFDFTINFTGTLILEDAFLDHPPLAKTSKDLSLE